MTDGENVAQGPEPPDWLFRPLPANAGADSDLRKRVDAGLQRLPDSLWELSELLTSVAHDRAYDDAANLASLGVWRALDRIINSGNLRDCVHLVNFARDHMTPEAQAKLFRKLAKNPYRRVRDKVRSALDQVIIHEVALPARPDGDWGPSGWFHGVTAAPPPQSADSGTAALVRHPRRRPRSQSQLQSQPRRTSAADSRRAALGLPAIATVRELRERLGIRSPKQLGYLLLASDRNDGPYSTFVIPKASGGERTIRAPKPQLRWVQRRILDTILAKVPLHDAAHGFATGRSTATNAALHQGPELLIKFDLTDFFPTVHYHRALGLFASLGYPVVDARFSADDASPRVAATLARLCCYTPDPADWGRAATPQGAPTSPAISNLVCRRLDARLSGLAQSCGGVYTRYADDLTFSFADKDLNIGRFRWWVDQVCHQEGFFLNSKKFRVIRSSQRQLVTGIVVNGDRGLRLPREDRRRFRAILRNCRAHGVASQARGNPAFASYLRGFASYAHMVDPQEGGDWLRQVEELLGREPEPEFEAESESESESEAKAGPSAIVDAPTSNEEPEGP